MHRGVYIYIVILVVAGVFGVFIGVFPVKKQMPEVKSKVTEEQLQQIRKTYNAIYWIVKIIQKIMLISAIWFILIPFVLDVPRLLEHKYPEVSGMVVSRATDYKRGKDVKIKDEKTGKIFDLQLFGGNVEISQKVKIIYLPHMKIGSLK